MSDLCDHGIDNAYVKVSIDQCGYQSVSKATPNDMGGINVVKYKKAHPSEVIKLESLKLDYALMDVQTKYRTCFKERSPEGYVCD